MASACYSAVPKHLTHCFCDASASVPPCLLNMSRSPLLRRPAGQGCHSHQVPQEQQTSRGLQHLARDAGVCRSLRALCAVQSHPWHLAHRASSVQDILLPIPKETFVCAAPIALQSIAGNAYAIVPSACLHNGWQTNFLTSNTGSDQAGALLTPCSAYVFCAMRLGTKARLSTTVCWTRPKPLIQWTGRWPGRSSSARAHLPKACCSHQRPPHTSLSSHLQQS